MNTDTKSIALFQAPPMGSHYEGGQYNVYVRFPERNARNRRRMATNVHVQVRHTGGVEVSGDAWLFFVVLLLGVCACFYLMSFWLISISLLTTIVLTLRLF